MTIALSARHNLEQVLRFPVKSGAPESGYDIYAILDGAMVRKLPDVCEEFDTVHECLFKGETDPAILVRAPWVMKLQSGSDLMEWFLEYGWGENWGIIAQVPFGTDFADVVAHFRQFVEVKLPDQKIVFFRFYDPRVLRMFLPTCDGPQIQALFSLPTFLCCEGEDANELLVYSQKSNTLTKRIISLPSLSDYA